MLIKASFPLSVLSMLEKQLTRVKVSVPFFTPLSPVQQFNS